MVAAWGQLRRMVVDVFACVVRVRHTLLTTEAAAGLSAAFNAPLADSVYY